MYPSITEFLNSHHIKFNLKQIIKHFKDKNTPRASCNFNCNHGDLTFTCSTCSTDPSTIFCQDCFLQGQHVDHHWIAKIASEGQCDCGDAAAFQSVSFCPKHLKNYKDNTQFQLDKLDKLFLKDFLFIVIQSFRLETFGRNMLEFLSKNNTALRIVAILVLLLQEFKTIDDFINFVQTSTYDEQLRINVPYNSETQSFLATEFMKINSNQGTFQLFAEVLPSDALFRCGSLRQIGSCANQLLKSNNRAVVLAMVQCINEPLGHYYGGKWNFYSDLFGGILSYIRQYISEDRQNKENEYEIIKNQTSAIQGCSFNKTLTTYHSIIYNQVTCLLKLLEATDLINNNMCLDINQKLQYFGVIETNYFSQIYLYYILIFVNFEFVDFLNLKEDVDPELLSRSHISQQAKENPALYSTTNISIHFSNLQLLLAYFFEHQRSQAEYRYTVLCQYLPQLYLVKFSHIFGIKIVEVINKKLSQKQNYQQVIQELAEPIVYQFAYQLAISCEAIENQNIENFVGILETCYGTPAIYSEYRRQISVLQVLLAEIPQSAISFITQIFKHVFRDNDCFMKAVFQFVFTLIFQPSEDDPDLCKMFLQTLIKSDLELGKIVTHSYLEKFPQYVVEGSISQVFSFQQVGNVLHNFQRSQRNWDFFEPTIHLFGIETLFNVKLQSSFKFVLNDRFLQPNKYASVFKLVDLTEIIKYGKNYHHKFVQQQETNLIHDIYIFRVMKLLNQRLECTDNELLSQFNIYDEKSVSSPTPLMKAKIDIRQRLLLLKQSKYNELETLQIQKIDCVQVDIKQQFHQCSICHADILSDMCVLAYQFLPVHVLQTFQETIQFQHDENITDFNTCGHYFHQSCLKANKYVVTCPICRFASDSLIFVPHNFLIDTLEMQTIAYNEEVSSKEANNMLNALVLSVATLEFAFKLPESRQVILKNLQYLRTKMVCMQIQYLNILSFNLVKKRDQQFTQVFESLQQHKAFQVLSPYFHKIVGEEDLHQVVTQLLKVLPLKEEVELQHPLSVLPSTSLDLFKATQSEVCEVCKLQLKFTNKSLNKALFPCACLNCKKYLHFNCCKFNNGMILCGHCNCAFGVYLFQLNLIVKGLLEYWPAPYRNRYGEITNTVITNALHLDQHLCDQIVFMIIFTILPPHMSEMGLDLILKQFPEASQILLSDEIKIKLQSLMESEILNLQIVIPELIAEEETIEPENQ